MRKEDEGAPELDAGLPDEGIWGGPVMIEDKADAVMFTIGLLRRLAAQDEPHSRERDYLLDAASTLEDLVEQQPGEGGRGGVDDHR